MTAHERRCRPTAPSSSSILRKRTRAHLEYEKSAPDPDGQFPCLRAITDRPLPQERGDGASPRPGPWIPRSLCRLRGRDKLPGVQARASRVPPLAARAGVTIEFRRPFKL